MDLLDWWRCIEQIKARIRFVQSPAFVLISNFAAIRLVRLCHVHRYGIKWKKFQCETLVKLTSPAFFRGNRHQRWGESSTNKTMHPVCEPSRVEQRKLNEVGTNMCLKVPLYLFSGPRNMHEQRKRILKFETSFSSLNDGGSFLMSAPGWFRLILKLLNGTFLGSERFDFLNKFWSCLVTFFQVG